MIDYKKMREDHRPRNIKLLFLAESPPVPRDGHEPFFYNEADMPSYGLFQAMMKACLPDQWLAVKEDLLDLFENDKGFYLIDASDMPLQKSVKYRELKAIGKAGTVVNTIKNLAEEGSFANNKIKLVIIGVKMHGIFYDYLLRERSIPTSRGPFDRVILNKNPLPFPNNSAASDEFVRELNKIVRDME